jgi:nitrogen regulatory protein PII-like uncharacterized protein
MNNDFAIELESIIKNQVNKILNETKDAPSLPADIVATDNLGEVIEKLIILHIRTWFLEDMAGVAICDTELANIKRKIDICFKQKRPMYIQAINKMIDSAIINGKSVSEDSVKLYKNF